MCTVVSNNKAWFSNRLASVCPPMTTPNHTSRRSLLRLSFTLPFGCTSYTYLFKSFMRFVLATVFSTYWSYMCLLLSLSQLRPTPMDVLDDVGGSPAANVDGHMPHNNQCFCRRFTCECHQRQFWQQWHCHIRAEQSNTSSWGRRPTRLWSNQTIFTDSGPLLQTKLCSKQNFTSYLFTVWHVL